MAMIAKEWRRLLRNPGTPWALLAYLPLPLLVAGAYLAALGAGQGISPHIVTQLGARTLNLVGTWQILLLALAAPFVASSLIAGEVEESTLHPLLAAGPSLLALVLAKLAAALAFLLVVIVAGLPLFALPVLTGGVTWPLIGRTVLMEVTTVILMTGLGLLLSGLGRRSGTVALVGIGLGLLLTLGGGLVTSSAPANVYNQDQVFRMMKMGGMPGMQAASPESLPRWLFLNPLVGLNSAINQSAGEGMLGLPGASSGPVYKQYRLWQVQPVGAALLALLSTLVATASVWIRIRWRWPQWRRPPSFKEVTSGD